MVGHAGESHPGRPGLHFGVKVEGGYVDTETLLVDLDVARGISLMPVGYEPVRFAGREFDIRALTGRTPDGCVEGADLYAAPGPPNDNVLVTVAGITSNSDDEILTLLPAQLGYPPERIYPFSYRGMGDLDLHEDYRAIDTFGDLKEAGLELQRLLVEIGKRYPDTEVDLVAHSQGGIVVRAALELLPRMEGMPYVEHVATLATPHRGAPLAAAGRDIDARWFGLVSAAIELSGAPVPTMRDAAVQQMIPGSDLMEELGASPRGFGTRYLSLAIANDLIVPADRGLQPGSDRSHVLGPEGWLTGHSAIVTSTEARGRLFDHLRDGPVTCRGAWDALGPWIGAGIGVLERALGSVFFFNGLP
jgi:pimeloyl-ACP methyl ester carboxylesterase